MKQITIPATVQIVALNTETQQEELQDLPFTEFLINTVLVHPAFGSSLEFLEASQDLHDRLTVAKVGDVIELDDKIWNVLDILVNRPDKPHPNVKVMRKLLPYMRAIRNAK